VGRPASVINRFVVDGPRVAWQLGGVRPTSSQHGKIGRPAHWGQGARARKDRKAKWLALLRAALRDCPAAAAWAAPCPAQFVIMMWGPSPPDSPNMGAHAKEAIDAMVTVGLIPDDRTKFAPWTHAGYVPRPPWAPPGPGMDLRIEPLAWSATGIG
jgi:hypothetical protein